MRRLRFIIAVLLAVSFTVLPVAAGMARTHGASSAMSMSASMDDCPCCNAAHKCAPDTCMLKCFSVSAIALDGMPLLAPLSEPFSIVAMRKPAASSPRPDPPPPRS